MQEANHCIRKFRLQSSGYLDVLEASSGYLAVLEASTGCLEVEKARRAVSVGLF